MARHNPTRGDKLEEIANEAAPLKGGPAPLTGKQIAHAALIAITGFQEGYDMCMVGTVLPAIQRSLHLCFPCEGGTSNAALAECTCPAKQFAVAALMLGGICGGLSGGYLADTLGRKRCLSFAACVLIVAVIGCVLSGPGTLSVFYAGRVLIGWSIGAGSATCSAFIAETAPTAHRGKCLIIDEVMICFGCIIALVIAVLVGDDRYRITLAVPAVAGAVQLGAILFFLEESPPWLAA
jgi:MFS family permease